MNRIVLLASVCITLVLLSCNKNLPSQPDTLVASKLTVTLNDTINSKDTIYIASNTAWAVTLETGVDWISAEPSGGTGDGMIVFTTIKKNSSSSRKTTNVQVSLNSGSRSPMLVTVIQLQYVALVFRSIFGGEAYDAFNSFTNASGGGYISVGYTTSKQGDATGGSGNQDLWIVKFDSEGKIEWHRVYGGSGNDLAQSIVRTPDNNYLILGSTNSNNGNVSAPKGAMDAWLIKINEDGDLLWEKTIGGSADEWLYNLKPDNEGNYIMAGWTASSDNDISENHGGSDAWLVRVNDQGTILWEQTYGGTLQDFAYDATPVSDGGYIFTGQVQSMDGDAADRTGDFFSAWIVKINSAGAVAGSRYIGESAFDFGYTAIEANNGDYIIAGETSTPGAVDGYHSNRDAFICRLDASGNFIWKKALGGSGRDEPADLIEMSDGNIVFAGLTMSNDGDVSENNGGEDAWVVKLDGGGNIVSERTFGGGLNDNVWRIRQLNNSQFAFVGRSENYPDMYPALTDISHGWFQVIKLQ